MLNDPRNGSTLEWLPFGMAGEHHTLNETGSKILPWLMRLNRETLNWQSTCPFKTLLYTN